MNFNQTAAKHLKFDSKVFIPTSLTVEDVIMIERYKYNLRESMLAMTDSEKESAKQDINQFEQLLKQWN